MVDATLPKRPWDPHGGDWQIIIDKNGIARRTMVNNNAAQEDHQRYEREKNAPQPPQQGGFSNVEGGSTALPGSAGAAPKEAPAATAAPDNGAEWLTGLIQKYAADIPMRMSLAPNAPVVTPEMLNPSDEQLAQLGPDQREGLGRVFLALVSRYYGNNTLQGVVLQGTRLTGYIPAAMKQHFMRLTGRGGV